MSKIFFLILFFSSNICFLNASDRWEHVVTSAEDHMQTTLHPNDYFSSDTINRMAPALLSFGCRTLETLLRAKVKNTGHEDPQELLKNALDAKKKGHSDHAKSLLSKLAHLGNPTAMLERAKIEEESGNLCECLRWLTLATQTFYISTASLSKEAHVLFIKIKTELAKEKKEKFKGNSKYVDKPNDRENAYNYLKAQNFEENLKTPNILWQNSFEFFYDADLAKLKRIFLLSSTGTFDKNLMTLSKSKDANPKNFMTLVRELALSKDQSEAYGLKSLAQFYVQTENYEEALVVYQELNTPESLMECGHIYKDTLFPKIQDERLLKKAIRFYESSGLPDALMHAGLLLTNYFFKEPGAYLKAFDYFEKSGTPGSRASLAEYIRYGLHGQSPDIYTAEKMLLTLQEELENSPTKSGNEILPPLYHSLGSIYQELKKIGEDPAVNLKRAISYYEKSGIPIAKNSLAGLLWDQGDIQEAIEMYKESGLVAAQINMLGNFYTHELINEEKFISQLISIANNEKLEPEELGDVLFYLLHFKCQDHDLINRLRKTLETAIDSIPESEKNMVCAQIAFADADYDTMYLYFSKMALNFSAKGLKFMKAVEDFLQNNKEDKDSIDKNGTQSQEYEVSDSSGSDTSVEHSLSPVALILQEEEPEEINYSSSKALAEKEDEPSKTETKAGTKAEKRRANQKRAIENNQEKYKKKLSTMFFEAMNDKSSSKQDQVHDIRYVFLDTSLEEKFKDLKDNNSKFQELLSDIKNCPWATTGSGKPEVLKGKFLGHKGCISRRINHEDRLVYKINALGEMLILSLEGHYKQ